MLQTVEYIKKHLNISDNAFIGLFLYGSQNYGLDTEVSDSDYICVVTDFGLSFTTLHTATNQIKVYNLYYFLNMLNRGDLECLECLYSKHSVISEHYKKSLNKFVSAVESVLNIDCVKRALCNKLAEHLSFIRMPKASEPEAARYSKKRLYWAIRVANQLSRISAGESFVESLMYPEELKEELLKIKTIENYLEDSQVQEIEENLKSLLTPTTATSETSLLTDGDLIPRTVARFRGLEHIANTRKS